MGKLNIRIQWPVTDVREQFRQEHVSGLGKDAQMRQVSTGWWITVAVEGGSLVLGIGPDQHDIAIGDTVSGTLAVG